MGSSEVSITTIVASLNILSTVFLTIAIWFIRKKNAKRHIQFISLALATVVILIAVFLYDKIVLSDSLKQYMQDGLTGSPFLQGFLASHILASVVTIPLVIVTLWHAFKKQISQHRIWARWTALVWYYASVTGIILYLLFLK